MIFRISRTVLITIILGSYFFATGCAWKPLSISSTSSILTSGENISKGIKVPQSVFSLQDDIKFYVYVKWDDPTEKYGSHSVVFNWYENEKLISTVTKSGDFDSTPHELWTRKSAAALGVGHFKVRIIVDNEIVGSAEFDIKQ